MNTPSPECGWTSRRVTYSKQMLETLSKIKKENGGRISITVEVYLDFYGNTFGEFEVLDLIRFAEDCDRMLVDWDKPNGQCLFEVVGNLSP